jgi:uncharacterized membrane protein YdbT with pleckstrin-like domain
MSAYVRQLLTNEEKMVYMTRKHTVVIGRALLICVFAVIVIAAAAVFASMQIGPIGWLLAVIEILPILQLLIIYLRWSNEEYIVTNRRVLKVEGVFSKHVFDSSLEKVNDIELDQSFMGRLLNYGNVEILTGSDIGENKFTRIANPIEFKRQMLMQKEAMGVMHDFGEAEQHVVSSQANSKQDIPGLISELDDLRKRGIIDQAEFDSKKDELLKRM